MPILVNKIEISDDEVHAEMQHHPAGDIENARHQAARALVVRQLLLQEAMNKKILNILETPSVEQEEDAIDKLIGQEVTVPNADEESCKRYYTQNQQRFMDKKTNKLLPFESVMTHIRDYMHARSLQTGLSHYIKILAGRAKIAGFDMEGSDTPLVQ